MSRQICSKDYKLLYFCHLMFRYFNHYILREVMGVNETKATYMVALSAC